MISPTLRLRLLGLAAKLRAWKQVVDANLRSAMIETFPSRVGPPPDDALSEARTVAQLLRDEGRASALLDAWVDEPSYLHLWKVIMELDRLLKR